MKTFCLKLALAGIIATSLSTIAFAAADSAADGGSHPGAIEERSPQGQAAQVSAADCCSVGSARGGLHQNTTQNNPYLADARAKQPDTPADKSGSTPSDK